MTDQSENEYQELDLSQENDLAFFQESAKAVFDEVSDFGYIIHTQVQSADESSQQVFATLVEKNDRLNELVKKCRTDFLPHDKELPAELIDELQQIYDDLILLRNDILHIQAQQPAQLSAETEKIEETDSQPLPMMRKLSIAHESDQDEVLLFGLSAPQPGPDSMKQIHAMREVLLLARDTHPSLMYDSEKQILVDKLFRKLGAVSSQGLRPETNIPEIVALMKAVNVPHAAVPTVSSIPVEHHNSPQATNSEQEPTTTYQRKRKTMSVSQDEDDTTQKSIAINIAKDATEEIAHLEEQMEVLHPDQNVLAKPQIVRENISQVEMQIVGQTEAIDPINTVIKKPVQPVLPVPDLVGEELQNQDGEEVVTYKSFVEKEFGSMEEFGKVLNSEIARIESLTTDKFQGWLGEKKASAFEMLQDMSVNEVSVLQKQKGLREEMIEKNVNYETLLTWFDLLPEMIEMTEADTRISFGELFTYWIIESEMAYVHDSKEKNEAL